MNLWSSPLTQLITTTLLKNLLKMKTKVPYFLTAFLLLLSGFTVNAQAPTLGTAANFVVFSSNGSVTCNVTNSLSTHLTGNVGTNTSGGTSTGFGNVNGVMQDNNLVSQLASADTSTKVFQKVNWVYNSNLFTN